MPHDASNTQGSTHKQLQLTPQEIRITQMVVSGATNAEIADHLCISSVTVHHHLDHIYKKLCIHRRTQLVAWFLQYGHSETNSKNGQDCP